MTNRERDLDWLLAPLSVEEFVGEIWEKRPYVVERDSTEYYAGMFSESDLDSVLEYGNPKPPTLRVVSEQQELLPAKYLLPDGRLNLNQLYKVYAEGHTIVINGLHEFWHPVAEFSQSLQRRLSHKVTPNAYLTPRGSRGLDPHYDTHDVFVVQAAGAKTWRIYGEAQRCPLLGTFQPVFSRKHLAVPHVIELRAGDLMYMPRGWIHEAETGDESSLHLTFGVYPVQWHDFMVKALTALSLKHVDLRQALPVGYLDNRDTDSMAERLQELAALLASEGSAADALSLLEDDFIGSSRAVPDGRFEMLDRTLEIDLETRLVKRPHLYCRVVPAPDCVRIQFPGNTIRGPLHFGEAMVFAARSDGAFAVIELPGLDDDRKVKLAQRLVRGGLLAFDRQAG